MQFHIKCVDGKVYSSDFITRAELEADTESAAQIAEHGSFEAMLDWIEEFLSDFSEMNKLNMLIGGEKRFFNPANIVWIQLDRANYPLSPPE